MEPHIYHLNRVVQFLYCAMGLALIGMGAWAVYQMGSFLLVFGLPLGALGIYYFHLALNSLLTLTETEISIRSGFGEGSAQLSEIESWRTISGGKSGTFWLLQRRDGSESMRISQNFDVDDAFLDFLSKLRNLNDLEISVVP